MINLELISLPEVELALVNCAHKARLDVCSVAYHLTSFRDSLRRATCFQPAASRRDTWIDLFVIPAFVRGIANALAPLHRWRHWAALLKALSATIRRENAFWVNLHEGTVELRPEFRGQNRPGQITDQIRTSVRPEIYPPPISLNWAQRPFESFGNGND